MQIIEITVSYEATQSLSDYSNVRPGIRLTVRLDEGDDPVIARQTLLDEARTIIYQEIDDCLFIDGKAPRYYNGPRYRVEYSRERRWVVILPDDDDLYQKLFELGDDWCSSRDMRPSRGMRLDQAYTVAARLVADNAEKQYVVVDCSDGDLSHLATVPPGQAGDQGLALIPMTRKEL